MYRVKKERLTSLGGRRYVYSSPKVVGRGRQELKDDEKDGEIAISVRSSQGLAKGKSNMSKKHLPSLAGR